MSDFKTKLNGFLFDGRHPVARPVEVVISDGEFMLSDNMFTQTYDASDIQLSPRIGQADRFIQFPDGKKCQCKDHPVLDQLPLEVESEGIVAWLESNIPVTIASIGIIIALLIFGYFFGLPVLTESVVKKIPISTEVSLGQNVIEWFDERLWFEPSNIDIEKQHIIQDQFAKFYQNLEIAPLY
jgi:hypothetical protein